MYAARNARRTSGFTLVEILIVVIILGILAAIVIPQFTNASQDARKSSLTSQLQTLRSQLELYKLQHRDQFPPSLAVGADIDGETAFAEMTVKTNPDHTTAGTPDFGPYLQAAPVNPLNGYSAITVVNDATDHGSGSPGQLPSTASASGWVLNLQNGKVWATALNPAWIYNEADPTDVDNTTAP